MMPLWRKWTTGELREARSGIDAELARRERARLTQQHTGEPMDSIAPLANTPRTDAALERVERDFSDPLKALVQFTRELERELNAEKANTMRLNAQIEALRTMPVPD